MELHRFGTGDPLAPYLGGPSTATAAPPMVTPSRQQVQDTHQSPPGRHRTEGDNVLFLARLLLPGLNLTACDREPCNAGARRAYPAQRMQLAAEELEWALNGHILESM
ncbi:hypothetical protein F2Q65_14905 [Thiohalocapsa marina]|uniref:Uncharacterized protein n=1 Tax=Thiohalocapsa marina TaxID=424902 RepID=A0A5M8FJ17_9GAMM|nr:hypothetical protein [Thiohalocapsa marina]KAA6183726.1 hypothetical protein F2Q65_14905 [Thiohalocapsa marina]